MARPIKQIEAQPTEGKQLLRWLRCDWRRRCQGLERSQPSLPVGLRHPRTMTHDFMRHGTAKLFAALDCLQGKRIACAEVRHVYVEWRRFLKQIEREMPKGLDVRVIVDNYDTHKRTKTKVRLAKFPRFTMHFTPTSSRSTTRARCYRTPRGLDCGIRAPLMVL